MHAYVWHVSIRLTPPDTTHIHGVVNNRLLCPFKTLQLLSYFVHVQNFARRFIAENVLFVLGVLKNVDVYSRWLLCGKVLLCWVSNL